MAFEIRNARPEDCEVIRDMIFELARYERLESACKASRGKIERELFGPNPVIRCVLGWEIDEATGREEPVAFALYFFNFSTFLTRDIGQRVILKSGLVPATQPVRLVHVKDEY